MHISSYVDIKLISTVDTSNNSDFIMIYIISEEHIYIDNRNLLCKEMFANNAVLHSEEIDMRFLNISYICDKKYICDIAIDPKMCASFKFCKISQNQVSY